jgi:hypothetical protein
VPSEKIKMRWPKCLRSLSSGQCHLRVWRAQEVSRQGLSERVSIPSPSIIDKHSPSHRYVEMLEQQQSQLVAGLQELYRRIQNGQGWEGAPLNNSCHGMPLTHDILENLGALKSSRQNSGAEHFEEDLNALQRRLFANGAEFMQRAPSESGSDSVHSPTFDQPPHKSPFTNPFPFGKLPPTPPTQSPFPQNASPARAPKTNTEYHPSSLQKGVDGSLLQRQTWASSGMALDDNMSLLNQYDSPINLDAMPNPFDTPQMPVGTIAPYLSMRDWNHDVDFQRYFSATTM